MIRQFSSLQSIHFTIFEDKELPRDELKMTVSQNLFGRFLHL